MPLPGLMRIALMVVISAAIVLVLRVFYDQPQNTGRQLSARVEHCDMVGRRSPTAAWCTLSIANGDRTVIYMPAAPEGGRAMTVSVQRRALSGQRSYQVISEESGLP